MNVWVAYIQIDKTEFQASHIFKTKDDAINSFKISYSKIGGVEVFHFKDNKYSVHNRKNFVGWIVHTRIEEGPVHL